MSGSLKFDLSMIVFFLKIREIREIRGKKKATDSLIKNKNNQLISGYKKYNLFLFRSQFNNFHNNFHCFLHTFHRNIFIFSMKIVSARKNIRTWQTFVG